MGAYVEYSRDAVNWYRGPAPTSGSRWQQRRLNTYDIAKFEEVQFNVSNYSLGLFWRVRAEFRWYNAPATSTSWLGSAWTGYTFPQVMGSNVYTFRDSLAGDTVCQFRS